MGPVLSLLSPTAAATDAPNWGQMEGKLRSQPPAWLGCGTWDPICGFLPGFRGHSNPPGLLSRLLRKHSMSKACCRTPAPSLLKPQRGSGVEEGEGRKGVSSSFGKSA